MSETNETKSKKRERGSRLYRMRAAKLWREGGLPWNVRCYIKKRFPTVACAMQHSHRR